MHAPDMYCHHPFNPPECYIIESYYGVLSWQNAKRRFKIQCNRLKIKSKHTISHDSLTNRYLRFKMLIENQRILPLKPTILWLLKQRFSSFQPIRTPSKSSHTFDCTPGNRCILSIHPVFQNIKKGSLKRKAYYLPRLFTMPPPPSW